MKGPSVSAIIPVRNGERYLADAIDSILAQQYEPIEIIVVDDGSTDGTADVARSYPQVRYIYQEPSGASAARNTGLAAATGELIGFLDHDDRWTPDKLEAQVTFLESNPDLGYVFSMFRHFMDGVEERPWWVLEEQVEGDLMIPSTCTLLARRWVFDKVGGFDTSYRIGEDTDWFVRTLDEKIPFTMIEQSLLLRRIHATNTMHTSDPNPPELFRILRASIQRKRSRATQT